jgi:hypothetical protein
MARAHSRALLSGEPSVARNPRGRGPADHSIESASRQPKEWC